MICLLCGNESHVLPSWRSLFCNDIEETVCKNCKGRFEKTGPGCRKCGLPGNEECRDCLKWETTRFSGIVHSGRSLYVYNEAMKAFLHQYKFLQDAALSTVFAADLNSALKKEKAIIVPIPMKRENLEERTFAQVDLALEAAQLPYVHLLRKTGGVQGKKNRAERMAAENLFAWNSTAVPKRIILFDDLYTTGTTMHHAAKVLKEAGAEEIQLFSMIRAY
ncbi:ComF family protein [Planococcus sp. FY231025]|uniref:ComF family protein n=1 Tax=Planococcus sp. FY231025 TaxID=3455699 RepID=UPI003F8E52EC